MSYSVISVISVPYSVVSVSYSVISVICVSYSVISVICVPYSVISVPYSVISVSYSVIQCHLCAIQCHQCHLCAIQCHHTVSLSRVSVLQAQENSEDLGSCPICTRQLGKEINEVSLHTCAKKIFYSDFSKPLRLLYSLIIYEIVTLRSLLFATSFFLSISEKCSYTRDCSCTCTQYWHSLPPAVGTDSLWPPALHGLPPGAGPQATAHGLRVQRGCEAALPAVPLLVPVLRDQHRQTH